MPTLDTEDRSPFVAAVRSVINSLLPNLRFMGDLEYQVDSQSGDYVDLRPVDTQAGLPPLPKVRFRGAPGVACELQKGHRVVVRFVNSSPGQAYIAAMEGHDGAAFVPLSLRVDASGTVDVGESASMVKLSTGEEFVALSNLVEQRFKELLIAINSAAVDSDGAILKDNLIGILALAGWNPSPPEVPTVAAEKVKAT